MDDPAQNTYNILKNRIYFLFIFLGLCHSNPIMAFPDNSKSDTLQANIYCQMADQFAQQTVFDSSIYYMEKAADIYKRLCDRYDESYLWAKYVHIMNRIGDNMRFQGKYDEAMDNYLKQALHIGLDKLGEDDPVIARIYNNMGIIYSSKGYYDKSLEYHEKALSLKIKVLGELNSSVAISYVNIGNNYWFKSDYDKALEYYTNALNVQKEILGENHVAVGNCYNNIGMIYGAKGDHEKSLHYFLKALEIKQSAWGENHLSVAITYNNIGLIYELMGACDNALLYFKKAEAVIIQLMGDNHPELANVYQHVGNTYINLENYSLALEYLTKALAIQEQKYGEYHPFIANTIRLMGEAYFRQRDFLMAMECTQHALNALVPKYDRTDVYHNPDISNPLSDLELMKALHQKAILLHSIYKLQSHNSKDIEMSLATFQVVVELIDHMRTSYKAEGSKIFLGEQAQQIYADAIQVAMSLYRITGNDEYKEQAFQFCEKTKSGVLLNSLHDAQSRQFAEIPDSLLEKEKELKIELTFNKTQRQLLIENGMVPDSLKLKKLDAACFALSTEYDSFIEYIETSYPKYYRLKYQTKVAAVEELQTMLSVHTALVDYFVADSVVYNFVISRDTFDVIVMKKDTNFLQMTENCVTAIRKVEVEQYAETSFYLYQKLIEPMNCYLDSITTLIIIPHDILYTLPFEALLTKQVQDGKKGSLTHLNYLINSVNISYNYSSTLYMYCMKEMQGANSSVNVNQRAFIGFAPVFQNDEKSNIQPRNLADLKVLGNDSDNRAIDINGKRYHELTYSEAEVREIVRLFENRHQQAHGYLHDEASEGNFKSNVGLYRYIHIATHGIMNETTPRLSGLIFSQLADTNSTEDGILYACETYNLDLNADLVVLSSCESGIGKLVKGEGMMALTRGFLYSGAANVVVSLWKVSDKQTSQLMIDFYRRAINLSNYAEALRAAKLKMIDNEATAFPKSWSSFVLIGR
ncbi:CHAT domain-containing protein [candidate division KSB1 bacterium]|nr:CHAT domain-containing protein [candidate division KSB1 bacterium]